VKAPKKADFVPGMENTLLTIITPVFNGSRYIRKCLENVANQAVPGIEHLIMDGASTDGTAGIACEFAQSHPHVRVISEKDKGQSDAMNKGIALARGTIIGFLNADDLYEPGVLPRVPEIFRNLPEPSFVCGNLNIWNPDGSFRHLNRPSRISFLDILSGNFEIPYNPSAYFYHKSLHDKVGLYDTEDHFAMDFEFLVRAASVIDFQYFDEIWGNFYLVPESKTQKQFSRHENPTEKRGEEVRSHFIRQLNPAQLAELELLKKSSVGSEKPVKVLFTDRLRTYLRKFLR
jgi:glycosyltransferase involved in cell wall biosynthesis